MSGFEWCCPFCDRNQIAIDENRDASWRRLYIGKTRHGLVGISTYSIRCVNAECNEIYLHARLSKAKPKQGAAHETVEGEELQSWVLRPESFAKPQPEYIPAALIEDYHEACAIRVKSPKAAATLARRCLQGMIRDFCGISKSRLIDEIKALRALVDEGTAPKGVEAETVDAIDAVRSVGNIGAHMEKDISLIVDVDPGEAQTLIELIEMLFREWYVARHERQERLARIQSIAAEKAALLAGPKAPDPSAVEGDT